MSSVKEKNEGKVIFVAGIDTDIGKTVATGLLAREFSSKGFEVITQKIAQTGCDEISEDIIIHRNIMGIDLLSIDMDGTTCPYVFKTPCSPHLAAEIDEVELDINRITEATDKLKKSHEVVLLEGAGGIVVPITRGISSLDYVCENNYPIILVSSSRVGSINHTLLTLEKIAKEGGSVIAILYNRADEEDTRVSEDTKNIIMSYLMEINVDAPIIDVYDLESYLESKNKLNISNIIEKLESLT